MSSRNYLIIGGTAGIGMELARKLINMGHRIFTASRRPFGIEGAVHFPFDAVRDELPVGALPQILDGFVYCPGTINLKPFHRLSDQDFQSDFEINLLGAVRCTRAVLGALKNSQQASIIFFSTVAVQQGMPFHASVSAAKGAVEGMALSLAAELSPKVRVNVISPSLTDTALASKLLSSDEKRRAASERHPLKRLGTASEIASLAYYLLSDEAKWITGQVFSVDGGISAIRS